MTLTIVDTEYNNFLRKQVWAMTMKIVDTDTVSGVGMMWIVDTIRSVQEESVTHHTTITIITTDIMDRNFE